ncbi:MAG: hypothetical protein IPH07_31275 [Deltaproteobacteria bacterium]|nr:hypothetical protein [Deltaproteobacteria bacterium]
MNRKLASSLFALARIGAPMALVLAGGCATTDDGDDTNATTISTSVSTTMTTTDSDSGEGSTSGGGTASTTASTTATSTDPTIDPTTDSSGGSQCSATDECIDDSMCNGGSCIECVCIGGGETGATMSDYNACDMCGAGETPISIMGLDGFCFCSPTCDGAMSACPEPTSGGGTPVCALGTDAMNPTQCVVICMDDSMCPTGGTCQVLTTPQGDVGLCTHPTPM